MKRRNRFSVPVLIATAVLIVLIAAIGMSVYSEPGVFISEVCTHNESIIYDSVGFYHDYFVLSNGSDKTISLSGYGISDDNRSLRKFIFDGICLDPGEDIMIWADVRSVFSFYGMDYSDDDAVYTGFGLRDHEMLYLTDPSGVVIDSLRIPVMNNDVSLLRCYAGDKGQVGRPKFLESASPVVSDLVAAPILSTPSGFFEDPFDLSIISEGNIVYYTLDGSNPYSSGIMYNGPVGIENRSQEPDLYASVGPVSTVYDQFVPRNPVSKATVVRAVAKSNNGTFSKESIATYFVGKDIREICEGTFTLSLVSDPDGLFSDDRGIYVTGNIWEMNKQKAMNWDDDLHYVPTNYNLHGRQWRRNSHLTLFNTSGECLFDEEDFIGIHGQSSRSLLQKGFNIRPLNIDSKVFEGLFDDAGASLMLRTGSESDVYVTGFRDAINGRIAENLDVCPQSSVCCQVYLNGEYWGCYNLQERLDASFVESCYGVPKDNINIIKIDPEPEALSERSDDIEQFIELRDFVWGHDFVDEGDFARFCEMVDINSLIDYYCAQIYFANDDTYYGNVGLWRSRNRGYKQYEDGKWRFILFDLDNTDGYAPNAAADIDSFVDGSYIGCNPLEADLFLSKLWNNLAFRELFKNRFVEILDTEFSFDRISAILNEYEETYTTPVVRSAERFGNSDLSDKKYRENVQTIRGFFKQRNGYMLKYLTQHMGD